MQPAKAFSATGGGEKAPPIGFGGNEGLTLARRLEGRYLAVRRDTVFAEYRWHMGGAQFCATRPCHRILTKVPTPSRRRVLIPDLARFPQRACCVGNWKSHGTSS